MSPCICACARRRTGDWGLRSYKGDPGMIGLEPTWDEHLANLVAVFREVKRVLAQGWHVLFLNYGDAYAGSWWELSPNR